MYFCAIHSFQPQMCATGEVPGNRADGEVSRGKGEGEVVAARGAVDVKHFAGEEEPRHLARLHRFRIDVVRGDAADRDN